MAASTPYATHHAQDLSRHVQGIEDHLKRLDEALRGDEPLAIETASQGLHKALADAVVVCRQARQAGQVALPDELRRKLMLAQSRVSALQSAVHRAGSSIERTLGILIPSETASTYGALGSKASPAAALNAAYR